MPRRRTVGQSRREEGLFKLPKPAFHAVGLTSWRRLPLSVRTFPKVPSVTKGRPLLLGALVPFSRSCSYRRVSRCASIRFAFTSANMETAGGRSQPLWSGAGPDRTGLIGPSSGFPRRSSFTEGPARFDKSEEKSGKSMERSGQGLHRKRLILFACITTGSPPLITFSDAQPGIYRSDARARHTPCCVHLGWGGPGTAISSATGRTRAHCTPAHPVWHMN